MNSDFFRKKMAVNTKNPKDKKGQIRSQEAAMLTEKVAMLSTVHPPSCTLHNVIHMRGYRRWCNNPLFIQSFHLLSLLPLALHFT